MELERSKRLVDKVFAKNPLAVVDAFLEIHEAEFRHVFRRDVEASRADGIAERAGGEGIFAEFHGAEEFVAEEVIQLAAADGGDDAGEYVEAQIRIDALGAGRVGELDGEGVLQMVFREVRHPHGVDVEIVLRGEACAVHHEIADGDFLPLRIDVFGEHVLEQRVDLVVDGQLLAVLQDADGGDDERLRDGIRVVAVGGGGDPFHIALAVFDIADVIDGAFLLFGDFRHVLEHGRERFGL